MCDVRQRNIPEERRSYFYNLYCILMRTGKLSRYSDWLRDGQSGDRILMWARFFAPVQTGPGAHLASCTMGDRSLPGVESGRGVTLTPHPLIVPRSKKQSRAIPLLSLRAFVACKMVKPTYYIIFWYKITGMLIFRRRFSSYLPSSPIPPTE
jgi:hypothetical protein